MIVQVTNSGADLNPNHFDMQFPGGGVGIFNGCSSQWGVPTAAWGNQYGGVGSCQNCYNLPAALQNGCLFIFDWFQGADNPTMNYVKVNCPQDLVAITGCSR